jgi:hypothetical protein
VPRYGSPFSSTFCFTGIDAVVPTARCPSGLVTFVATRRSPAKRVVAAPESARTRSTSVVSPLNVRSPFISVLPFTDHAPGEAVSVTSSASFEMESRRCASWASARLVNALARRK